MGVISYSSINVRFDPPLCFLRFDRAAQKNTITPEMVFECHQVLDLCNDSTSVLVIEGSQEVFCSGADFSAAREVLESGRQPDPTSLYDLWLRMATGPVITIAHVRGKVVAGGLGFVAASDIVLASEDANFALSEMLFGLFPACVMPFLTRRIGFQRAHYLTLTTEAISAAQATVWGLVDASAKDSEVLLRRHLARLRRMSNASIQRYKQYTRELSTSLVSAREAAIAANREIFSDPQNLRGIVRYVERGLLPWEKDLSDG